MTFTKTIRRDGRENKIVVLFEKYGTIKSYSTRGNIIDIELRIRDEDNEKAQKITNIKTLQVFLEKEEEFFKK